MLPFVSRRLRCECVRILYVPRHFFSVPPDQDHDQEFLTPVPESPLAPLKWSPEFLSNYGLDFRLFQRCRKMFDKALRTDRSGSLSIGSNIQDSFVAFARQRYAHQMDEMKHLADISDLRAPEELYPFARAMKRKFVFHAGPTNSGKTHSALERLRDPSVRAGLYCAPLRLLALEIFDRFNAAGVPCDLLTGEERRERVDSRVLSCTVEMASTSKRYDVAVIDEIQMLGDISRGWAWTRALLGVCANEVHLCGEARAFPLVQSILAACGETIELKEYNRLTPCVPAPSSLHSSLKGIRPGDAVVAFSRRNIFRLKFAIEKQSGLACSVVYGSLPPPVRAQQAAKFNTHESPVLVASDAIAMGLNMHIGRIVFSTMDKFDGTDVRPLENPLIRQIGGRAGRYQSRYPEGLVTCLHEEDMPRLKTAFSETNIAALSRAGLKPTFEALAQFSSSMPQAALSHVMDRFVALTQLNADSYFVCDFEDEKIIADALEHVPGLSLEDRYVFCCSPSDTDSAVAMGFLLRFARAHAKGEPVRLNVGLPVRPPMTEVALQKLEALYAVVDLYMWLSYRFPHTFCERDAAAQARERARYLIEEGLEAQTRQAAERDESAVLRRPHRQPRPVQREMSAEEQLVAEEARREERRQRRKWKRRVSGMGDDASGQIFTLGEDEASLMRWQDYQTAR